MTRRIQNIVRKPFRFLIILTILLFLGHQGYSTVMATGEPGAEQQEKARKPGKWIFDKARGKWWYKFDDGSYPKDEWEIINNRWYHFDKYGWMEANKWIKSYNKWYYLNSSGATERGWLTLKGKTYHFADSGAMETGWQKIKNIWYYFDTSGAMRTGWVRIEYDDYFFENNGAYNPTVKRALILGETSTAAVPINDVYFMYNMFLDYKNKGMNFANITKYPNATKANIFKKMDEVFSGSDESDINYLYMTCHGGASGVLELGYNREIITGYELKNRLLRYKGKFVVFLDCCHAGVIISKEKSADNEEVDGKTSLQILEDFIEPFKEDLPKSGELAIPRFMVFASSRKDQLSWGGSTNSVATKAWLMGAGWNPMTEKSDVQRADTNQDKRVSVQELYNYSRSTVFSLNGNKKQEVVVYPMNCNFNILIRIGE